jgi:hypothetical protein
VKRDVESRDKDSRRLGTHLFGTAKDEHVFGGGSIYFSSNSRCSTHSYTAYAGFLLFIMASGAFRNPSAERDTWVGYQHGQAAAPR